MNIAWPVYILIVGIVLQGLLAFYVVEKKKEGRIAWIFLLLSFAIMLWQVIYIFQANSIYAAHLAVKNGTMGAGEISFNHAIPTFDRLRYFATCLTGPTFLYLVVSMFFGPKKDTDRLFRMAVFAFPVSFIILNVHSIATSTHFLHTGYYINEVGFYEAERGIGFWYNLAYNYTFILVGFLILIWKFIKPAFRLQRKQAVVFFLGTLVAFLGNVRQLVTPTAQLYEWTPIFFTLASIFFALGIIMYKMFLIEPKAEEASEGKAAFDLSMGHGFVVYEDEPSYALEIFADMAKHSVQGLAFVSAPPQDVKMKHGLEQTPILQTGERSSPTIFAYSSRDERDYILYIADRFSRDASNTIILLSGLDNFIESSPESARDMLFSLKRIASDNQSRLLVSMPKDKSKGIIAEALSDFVEL